MKTIKGKLMSVLMILTFGLVFAASVVSVLAAGTSSIGSALGMGVLTAVVCTAVMGLVVRTILNRVLTPIEQLKLFAAGDFSEKSGQESVRVKSQWPVRRRRPSEAGCGRRLLE